MPQNIDGLPDDLATLYRAFEAVIGKLIDRLKIGALTPEQWEREMKVALAKYITASYKLGAGAEEFTETARLRVLEELRNQLSYLQGFREEIDFQYNVAENMGYTPETWTDPESGMPWVRWANRAAMYANSTVPTYWAGATEGIPLPAMPGDQSTQCWGNCRCSWNVVTLDASNGDYDAYWVLDPAAEHCQTCKQRDVDWQPLQIRQWALVLPNYTITTTERKDLLKEVLSVALKGGKGSGNHGHAGRPGKVGGSTSRNIQQGLKIANFFEDSGYKKENPISGAFWMDRKGNCYIGKTWMTHYDGAREGLDVVISGVKEAQNSSWLANEMMKRGFVRLGLDLNTMYVEGKNLQPAQWRKLFKIHKDHQKSYPDSTITWEVDGHTGYEWYTIQKVMAAGLKYSQKGGPGSGNFSHAGRPGKVGGSAPASAKYVKQITDVLLAHEGDEYEPDWDISGYDIESTWMGPNGRIYGPYGGHEDIAKEALKVAHWGNWQPWSQAKPFMLASGFARVGKTERGIYVQARGLTKQQFRSALKLMRDYEDLSINFDVDGIRGESIWDFRRLPQKIALKGGKGSGNFGHAGRPGQVGGSGRDPKKWAAYIGFGSVDTFEPEKMGRSALYSPMDGKFYYAKKYSLHAQVAAGYVLTHPDRFDQKTTDLARKVIDDETTENETLESAVLQKTGGVSLGFPRKRSGNMGILVKVILSENEKDNFRGAISTLKKMKAQGKMTDSQVSRVRMIGWREDLVVDFARLEDIAGLRKMPDDKTGIVYKGGKGSGNFGHAGRPGQVGGSQGRGHRAQPIKHKPIDHTKLITVDSISDWKIGRMVLREDGKANYLPKDLAQGKFVPMTNTHTLIFAAQVMNDPKKFSKKMREKAQDILDKFVYEDTDFETLVEEQTGGISVEFEQLKKSWEPKPVNRLRVVMTANTPEELTQKVKRVKRFVDVGNLPTTFFEDIVITAAIPPRFRSPEVLEKFGLSAQDFEGQTRVAIDRYFNAEEFDRFASFDSGYHARLKGGPGSGNFSHAGRPGKVGGSAPRNRGLSDADRSLIRKIGYQEDLAWGVNKPETFLLFPDGRIVFGNITRRGIPGFYPEHTLLYAGYILTHQNEFGNKRYWNEDVKDWSAKTIVEGARQIIEDDISENEATEREVMKVTGAMSMNVAQFGGQYSHLAGTRNLYIKNMDSFLPADKIGVPEVTRIYKDVRKLYREGKLPERISKIKFMTYADIISFEVDRFEDFSHIRNMGGTYAVEYKEVSLKERLERAFAKHTLRVKGGPGSGHYGHVGIPGHQGGSAPRHGVAEVAPRTYVRSEAMEAHRDIWRLRGYRETTKLSEIPDDVERMVIRGNGQIAYMDDGLSFHTRIYASIILQNKKRFSKALIQKSRDILESIENEDKEIEDTVSDWDDAYSLDIQWGKAIPGKVMLRYMGDLGEREIAPELTRMVRKLQRMVKRGDLRVVPKEKVRGVEKTDIWAFRVSAGNKGIVIPAGDLESIAGVTVVAGEVNARLKGGKGSGNWGHAGRPGKRGGSQPKSGNVHDFEMTYPTGSHPSNEHIPGTGPKDVSEELAGKLHFGKHFHPAYKNDDALLPEHERTARDIQGWLDGQKMAGVDVLPVISKIVVADGDIQFEESFAKTKLDSPEGQWELSKYGERGKPGGEVYERAKKRFMEMSEDVLGYYSMNQSSVYLRPIRDGFIHNKGDDYPADLVFAHECAHALKDSSNNPSWNVKYYQDPEFDRFTKYSRADADEGFAECYLTYLNIMDGLKRNKVNLDNLPSKVVTMAVEMRGVLRPWLIS